MAKAERNSEDSANMAERQKIGELIRQKRKVAQLTLQEMEARTGIDNSNLSRIERGIQELSNSTRARIAKVLGIPIAQLSEVDAGNPVCDTTSVFSQAMRSHRTGHGITLVDVHEMTGLDPVRLLRLERGEVFPDERETRLISLALGFRGCS